jgi:hypothetical protein
MTQPTTDTPTSTPVSTVTKHIKIYSDNPIHDCIDRIINSCACFDEGIIDSGLAATQMMIAAHELFNLASIQRAEIQSKNQREFNESNPN